MKTSPLIICLFLFGFLANPNPFLQTNQVIEFHLNDENPNQLIEGYEASFRSLMASRSQKLPTEIEAYTKADYLYVYE